MIPGIVASQYYLAPTPSGNIVVYPMTYDEKDSTNTDTLTRQGGLAPLITPQGFEGNGYDNRYSTTTIPAWAVAGELSIAANVLSHGKYMHITSARECLIYAGNNLSSGQARLSIEKIPDPKDTVNVVNGIIAARSIQSSVVSNVYLGRPGYRYETQTPDLTVGGLNCLPQGIVFLDEDNYLFNVHVEDTESIVYKYNIPSKSVVGQFTFGTTTHGHITCMARRGNGDVWFGDYATGSYLLVDVDSSLSSGTAVISHTLDASAIFGAGALEFCTLSGTEYFIISGYNTADTNGYVYFFPTSVLLNSTLVEADRVKRFLFGRRIQGECVNSTNTRMYITRNSLYGSSQAYGFIQEIDLPALFALSDGATVNSTTNASVILDQWNGPSPYPEDVAIQPNTGKLFIPTEGNASVADQGGYLAVWSWDFSNPANNFYEVHYNNAGTMSAYVNEYLMGTASVVPDEDVECFSVGGFPVRTASQTDGFCFDIINNFAIADHKLTTTEIDDLINDNYEASELTVYNLTLTNPGAEAGSATGWTNETGSMAVRSSNPLPFAGSYYFFAGPNAVTLSRQRVNLALAGVDSGDINTNSWVKVKYRQASYDGTSDPGSMGVRLLNSGSTISSNYDASLTTLDGPKRYWYPRSYPVALTSATTDVDALYNAPGRTGGTNYDLYIDNIELVIYAP